MNEEEKAKLTCFRSHGSKRFANMTETIKIYRKFISSQTTKLSFLVVRVVLLLFSSFSSQLSNYVSFVPFFIIFYFHFVSLISRLFISNRNYQKKNVFII